MRLPFAGFLLLFAAPSLAFAQGESRHSADWGRWARAFSTYAAKPSASNADALREALAPSARNDTLGVPPSYDSLSAWLTVLDRRVKSRDTVAVGLAFAIEPWLGSGEVSEALEIMLGQLIRIDPRLFLTALRTQAQLQSNVSIPGANLGPDFVDRMQAECRELRTRIRSLETVNDSALAVVKRRALARLATAAQAACNS